MVESHSTRDSGRIFVGRQQEMVVLEEALNDAKSGQTSLVMLAGEPGIGKTRTAHELAALAEQRGAQALHRETLDSCNGALCDLISDTVDLLPPGEDGRRKSDLRKNGTKMLTLLTEEGLTVPPSMQEVFLT